MDLYECVKHEILTLDEYNYFSATFRIDTVEAFICRLPQMMEAKLSKHPDLVLREAKKLVPNFNPYVEMPEKGKGALKPPVQVRSKASLLKDYTAWDNDKAILEVLIDIRDALIRAND